MTRTPRITVRTLGPVLCAAVSLILFVAPAAHAETLRPWWHLTSGSRPAFISHDAGLPGEATAPGVDEVQQFKIEEPSAVIVGPRFSQHEIEEEEYRPHPEAFAEVTKTMSAAEIQQALEKPEIYGAGNVRVTGGPETYTVTFIGALAERPVALIHQGYAGQASITQQTEGVLPKGGTPAADEVQELNIEEETALIVGPRFSQHEIEEEEYRTHPEAFAELTKTMSAAEVQQGLEKSEIYGAGNVKVTGGPGKYTVTFEGTLADQSVALMRQGYPGQASITERTKGTAGKPPAEPLDGELYMTAENVGDANANGSETPVKLTDVIPHGLHAVGVAGTEPFKQGNFQAREPIPCTLEENAGVQTATCTFSKQLVPYDQLEMRVNVKISAGAHTGELNQFSLTGGNAEPAAVERPITVSSAPVPFGVENFEMGLEEEGGAATVQAGRHPFQFTTTIALNQLNDINPLSLPTAYRPEVSPPALAKDLHFNLPAGLIGNPTSIRQCTTAQFFQTGGGGEENFCPPDTAVGVATVTVHEPATVGTSTLTLPVFNLEPHQGEPARFGFYAVIANSPVFIDTSVRTGSDYGVTVNVQNITQTAAFLSSEVTFWGVPNAVQHNDQRGWGCLKRERGATVNQPCTPSEEANPKPFLALPTDCETPLSASVEGDSWQNPGSFFDYTEGRFEPSSKLTGCDRLAFNPELDVKPDAHEASKPTGMNVDVHVPQETNENAAGDQSSNVRDIKVTFPEGVSLNPATADGLQACSEGQVGLQAGEGAFGEYLFTPTLPEAFCPDASKLATVTIKSPVLPAGQYVQGAMYLASPAPEGEAGKNPFNSLLADYIIAQDPTSGVLVKLPGETSVNATTGRITSTFQNNPQLPFEDAEIHLLDGERAPLTTPSHCGTYTTEASFTPWSGTAPVTSRSSFTIESGPGGGACPPAPLPFTPALQAGTTNPTAGAFSPLTLSVARGRGQQPLEQVQGTGPAGLSAILTGVTLCPEPQASQGNCPANSRIGHAIVTAGEGNQPLTLPEPGQPQFPIYLTGPYHGAPFGASIVTPIIAGPLNLGTIVTRARISVDPHTAQVTVATDPLPQIIKGLPTQIRSVTGIADRPGFTFNPTGCSEKSFNGSAQGAPLLGETVPGATAAIFTRFQVGSCGELKFTPKVAVSTAAHASRLNGASVHFKIAYPKGALGTQSWFNQVKFVFPKQLSARLATLQKSCLASVFEHDRVNCPPASIIGHAIVHTEVLPVPLEGPVYFVSNAGAAFPDAVLVLSGYGITIELHGNTLIKHGITSATFRNTPDVPFESIEVNLPNGRYSEFAANLPHESYDFCGQKLILPTEIKASNGLEIHQNTTIGVTGCPKTKTRAQKLAAALKACHKKHGAKRASCEKAARKAYGARGRKSTRKGR